MGKRREPSCTHNHDVMRRELRDKEMPPCPCPTCGWVLSPAREARDVVYSLTDMRQVFEEGYKAGHGSLEEIQTPEQIEQAWQEFVDGNV